MNNIMIDLETWGLVPGSAIRSIGAVAFDPHDDGYGETFYANITDESCLAAGLVKDESTEKWWARQSFKAQEVLLVNQRPLLEVAESFDAFWRKSRALFVWGNGAGFDPVLWEHAMAKLGRKEPWHFRDIRCVRTAYDMGLFEQGSVRVSGVKHNALDDCRYQVACVQRAYRNVHGKKEK